MAYERVKPTDIFVAVYRRVRKIAKSDYCFVVSGCLSIRPFAWDKSAPTGWIFMKFDICLFLQTLSIKFKFH